jgi:hypothetical protein
LLFPEELFTTGGFGKLLVAKKGIGDGERKVEANDLGWMPDQFLGQLPKRPSRGFEQQPLVEIIEDNAVPIPALDLGADSDDFLPLVLLLRWATKVDPYDALDALHFLEGDPSTISEGLGASPTTGWAAASRGWSGHLRRKKLGGVT